MVEGEIVVKVVPDTRILDKELKKKRTFAGLLGFGGGADVEKKEPKSSKKSNKLLGGILKSVGAIFGLSVLFSGLFKLLRPFVELFTALSFLVWFPLWKALKPALEGLSKFVKNVAKEGGGFTGLVKGAEKTAEEAFEGQSAFDRIVKAISAFFIAAGLIIIVAILGGIALIPALIIAAIAAVVVLIILAWEPIKKLLGIIAQAWRDFFKDIATAFKITVEFFKNLGSSIWGFIQDGLQFISNLGERIWNFIKRSLSGIGDFFGGIGRGVKSFFGFDDFIQRPGQAPTSFSPNDTIIGVKNPSSLFGGSGGGNTIHNTFQLGPINNDVDVRLVAEKIAEINKEELAMSTGSQRF